MNDQERNPLGGCGKKIYDLIAVICGRDLLCEDCVKKLCIAKNARIAELEKDRRKINEHAVSARLAVDTAKSCVDKLAARSGEPLPGGDDVHRNSPHVITGQTFTDHEYQAIENTPPSQTLHGDEGNVGTMKGGRTQ